MDTMAPQTPPDWRAPEPVASPKPFWKKKRFIIPAALAAIIAVAPKGEKKDAEPVVQAQAGEVSETPVDAAAPAEVPAAPVTTAAPASAPKSDGRLYLNRPDSQKEDKERRIGQPVELSGFTATPSAPTFKQSLSMFEEDGYVIIDVGLLNRDKKTQSYGSGDWKLQTPNGQVLDVNFVSSVEPTFEVFGDLINGGRVAGKIVFEVGPQKGDFYLIYKPDAFDSARGIWQVKL